MIATIGFIGLGIMGRPQALNLIKGGYKLNVFARRPESMLQLLNAGAKGCDSAKDVAAQSDITFIMVADTPDVEEMILGELGVIQGAKPGSIIVDMSTISPAATRNMAEKLASRGIDMLDAPVSGGEVGAINGTLSIMVGGKEDAFSRVKPLFDCMGKNVVHIGGNGAGQVCKACNQIVVAVTIEAVSEALTFARKNNVEVHGKRMLDNDFKPGFKVKLHQKDMNIVMQAANQMGLALPAASLVSQHLNALMGAGDAELDSSAIVKVIEKMNR
jgi:3-hydroxyisobutyrate dehydrogenase-like beta-hydroxyacid dehydrogenase